MDSVRYPIGSFEAVPEPSQEQRLALIEQIPIDREAGRSGKSFIIWRITI